MFAVALCITKCVQGLIAGAATLDVTSEVGTATGIAKRPRHGEDFETMIDTFTDTTGPASLICCKHIPDNADREIAHDVWLAKVFELENFFDMGSCG